MGSVFTPRLETGERLRVPLTEVFFEDGYDNSRGPGDKGHAVIAGKRYKIIGAACSLPKCYCDAIAIPVE